jgi:hypothetical protein
LKIIVFNGFILCAIQIFAGHRLAAKETGPVIMFGIFSITEILLVIGIAKQPKSEKPSYFEVSKKNLHFPIENKSNFFFQSTFHEVCEFLFVLNVK